VAPEFEWSSDLESEEDTSNAVSRFTSLLNEEPLSLLSPERIESPLPLVLLQ
jgi:hypothetical protein